MKFTERHSTSQGSRFDSPNRHLLPSRETSLSCASRSLRSLGASSAPVTHGARAAPPSLMRHAPPDARTRRAASPQPSSSSPPSIPYPSFSIRSSYLNLSNHAYHSARSRVCHVWVSSPPPRLPAQARLASSAVVPHLTRPVTWGSSVVDRRVSRASLGPSAAQAWRTPTPFSQERDRAEVLAYV
jgi:hypothetical protein